MENETKWYQTISLCKHKHTLKSLLNVFFRFDGEKGLKGLKFKKKPTGVKANPTNNKNSKLAINLNPQKCYLDVGFSFEALAAHLASKWFLKVFNLLKRKYDVNSHTIH